MSINSKRKKKTKGWWKKQKNIPLISGSCCGICFLLSGSCGCHSDQWGRNAERLYHSDGKHTEREGKREEVGEWRKYRRGKMNSVKRGENKMTKAERTKSDSSGD